MQYRLSFLFALSSLLLVATNAEIFDVVPSDSAFWTEASYKNLTLRVGDSIVFNSNWMIHNLWHSTNQTNPNVLGDYANCNVSRIEQRWSKLSCDCTAIAQSLPPLLQSCDFPAEDGTVCPVGEPQFPLTYQLLTTGEHYFACSVPNHCSQGMKMHVTVQPRTPHYGYDNGDFGPSALTVNVPLDLSKPQWIISPYPNVKARTGDYLRFVYDTAHNVYQWNGSFPFPSEGFPAACSASHWVQVGHNDSGTAPSGFLMPLTSVGVYHFACLEPQHCEAGMHFEVTTTARPRIPRLPDRDHHHSHHSAHRSRHHSHRRGDKGEGESHNQRSYHR